MRKHPIQYPTNAAMKRRRLSRSCSPARCAQPQQRDHTAAAGAAGAPADADALLAKQCEQLQGMGVGAAGVKALRECLDSIRFVRETARASKRESASERESARARVCVSEGALIPRERERERERSTARGNERERGEREREERDTQRYSERDEARDRECVGGGQGG